MERANQFLKLVIEKVTQETSLGWKEALLWTRIIPKEQFGVSPYEMLYGRPFVYVNEFFLDPEAQAVQSYTIAIGQFQQDSKLVGFQPGPKRF